MLSHRVFTALALLPPFLAAVFLLPTPWFAAVIGVVVLLGALEWLPMIGLHRWSVAWAVFGLLAGLMALVAGSVEAGVITPAVLLLGVMWWLLAPLFLWHFSRRVGYVGSLGTASGLVVGLLLLLPSWTALVWLHAQVGGPWLVLLLFVMTWMADIGAYFAGRRFGRHRLAPAISPGKTLEGFAGGLMLALLSAVFVWQMIPIAEVPVAPFLFLLLLAIIYSVIGDLFESMVKRRAGVKDSGALLPGHGGVLDRIDSITASATIFAGGLYLIWL